MDEPSVLVFFPFYIISLFSPAILNKHEEIAHTDKTSPHTKCLLHPFISDLPCIAPNYAREVLT